MSDVLEPKLIVFTALLVFIAISVWLGTVAQRMVRKGSFLTSYFLGNRGLGVWTMALTATVQSGGTFMGYPALIYSHGWIVLLWIGGYMVVPLISFGLFAKRLAHLSRQTGAITVPDLFRQRFESPALGMVASLLVILLMSLMMVAQFKAGAIIMKLCWPFGSEIAAGTSAVDWPYYTGLILFAVTVVGYTLIGGFMASVWTDLFQSVMMLLGVIILLVLTLPAVTRHDASSSDMVAATSQPVAAASDQSIATSSSSSSSIEAATRGAVANTSRAFAAGPGYEPGGREFLPLGLALSYFFIWPFAGAGTPASMVRVMAAQSTQVLRRSMTVLCIYNMMIYIPLVVICVAGRSLIPNLEKPDEIIPTLALQVGGQDLGGSLLSALIIAAPFGAVMATVSCYLLVISSGLVRDIYMRFMRPKASYGEVRLVTYVSMILVGLIAIAANIQPVKYLQAVVVLSSTVAAASFLVPVFMACYWRRANAPGTLAAMISGASTIFGLFTFGWIHRSFGYDQGVGMSDPFRPYYLLGVDPVLWGVAISAILGVIVCLATPPMSPERTTEFFGTREQGLGVRE